MEGKEIRLLRAEEIECRVSTINEKGVSLLLFKDARVDQKLLDEAFTPFGWKRSHQLIDGNLYCTVEVWDKEKQQWVGKQDVGTMSYSEKEKGQASDSFKRACFNWGLGRELYTAPFIWIPAGEVDIRKKAGGKNGEEKYYTNDRFRVKSISYDGERAIDSLSIVNSKNWEVYTFGREGTGGNGKAGGRKGTLRTEPAAGREASYQQMMTTLDKELQRTGVALEAVLERYHIQGVEEMTQAMYQDAMSGLKKSKSRKAA